MEKIDEKSTENTRNRKISDRDMILHIMSQMRIKTAKEFADKVGVSRQVIGSILANKIEMSPYVKGAILGCTDVNPIWLETGEGEILKVPRASESDYIQVLRKEIELKNEIIRSKEQTISLLNKLLFERELLLDEKNISMKMLTTQLSTVIKEKEKLMNDNEKGHKGHNETETPMPITVNFKKRKREVD